MTKKEKPDLTNHIFYNEIKDQYLIKFEQLKETAKIDCRSLSTTDVNQNFDVSGNVIKWLSYLQDWRLLLLKIEKNMTVVRRNLYEYYRNEYDVRFETKDELRIYVESDTKYQTVKIQIDFIKQVILFCEQVIESLRNKQWEIKNWISYQNFINGNNA